MAERTSMSLPAAKDLRAHADRVIERAVLAGTPRTRFLRSERRRLSARLLPTLALAAISTGIAAAFDLLRDPPVSRSVTLAQGLTAVALAGLTIATNAARRKHVLSMSLAVAGSAIVIVGWGMITRGTGGADGPYALAVPLGLAILLLALPLLPWHAPVLAGLAALAVALGAPGAPVSAYLFCLVLGGTGWALARSRRRRALRAFRRVERLAASVARIRRVQDQLVVVEKLEALRVLVGGMAHELNNALAVSIASTEQIVRIAQEDPGAAASGAQRALRGLVRIRGTIDRLKRFALAEEGVLEPADLCGMLDFALESAVGRARSGVAIDRDYEGDLPLIDTHVAALAEALFQVAKNAVESMPKGGVLRAAVRRSGERVVVSVADEGQGIPASRLGKVFDPFYARELNDTTYRGGRILESLPGRSGLGLSAVYGLVSAIGGKVDIQSEVGKGTEVSISLPGTGRSRPMSSRPPPPVR